MPDRRQLILTVVDDLAADLVYDDRKEDEDLPGGAIEEAIAAGEIDVDQIVGAFRRGLCKRLGPAGVTTADLMIFSSGTSRPVYAENERSGSWADWTPQ